MFNTLDDMFSQIYDFHISNQNKSEKEKDNFFVKCINYIDSLKIKDTNNYYLSCNPTFVNFMMNILNIDCFETRNKQQNLSTNCLPVQIYNLMYKYNLLYLSGVFIDEEDNSQYLLNKTSKVKYYYYRKQLSKYQKLKCPYRKNSIILYGNKCFIISTIKLVLKQTRRTICSLKSK